MYRLVLASLLGFGAFVFAVVPQDNMPVTDSPLPGPGVAYASFDYEEPTIMPEGHSKECDRKCKKAKREKRRRNGFNDRMRNVISNVKCRIVYGLVGGGEIVINTRVYCN